MRRKSYRYLAGLIVLLVFLVFSKNAAHNKQGLLPTAETLPLKSRVERVIDGDTIVIEGGLRVRYIGIDTPETKHPEKSVEYFGEEASLFNKRLVSGKEVRLEYDVQKFDKYGRLLAYVYADGVFVNARLVEEGYAQILTIPPNVKYSDLFLRLQKTARGQNRGLWAKR